MWRRPFSLYTLFVLNFILYICVNYLKYINKNKTLGCNSRWKPKLWRGDKEGPEGKREEDRGRSRVKGRCAGVRACWRYRLPLDSSSALIQPELAFLFFVVFVVYLLSHVPLFCDPMNGSLPGSSIHGISQARILKWVPISFSRGSPQPRDQSCISCIGRQIIHHQGSISFLVSPVFSFSSDSSASCQFSFQFLCPSLCLVSLSGSSLPISCRMRRTRVSPPAPWASMWPGLPATCHVPSGHSQHEEAAWQWTAPLAICPQPELKVQQRLCVFWFFSKPRHHEDDHYICPLNSTGQDADEMHLEQNLETWGRFAV